MESQLLDIKTLKKCATTLRVCAHPVRLRIIMFLSQQPLCVFEVQEKIGLPENETSQHLRKLQSMGILHNERKGKKMFYSVPEGKIDKINEVIKILSN
jgi:DNA-binding transcriptional ArsR family regulator